MLAFLLLWAVIAIAVIHAVACCGLEAVNFVGPYLEIEGRDNFKFWFWQFLVNLNKCAKFHLNLSPCLRGAGQTVRTYPNVDPSGSWSDFAVTRNSIFYMKNIPTLCW